MDEAGVRRKLQEEVVSTADRAMSPRPAAPPTRSSTWPLGRRGRAPSAGLPGIAGQVREEVGAVGTAAPTLRVATRATRRGVISSMGAAIAIGLCAGLAACASAPAPKVSSAARDGVNLGGAAHPATPAQSSAALSSFAAYRWADASAATLRRDLPTRLISTVPGGRPVVSSNWSGYQVLAARTHVAARSASGSWRVPPVSDPNKTENAFSGTWVGIGGACADPSCQVSASPDLIQLGTAADATPSGRTVYYAWYELIPAAPVYLPTLHVAPGDTVNAALAVVATSPPVQGGGQGSGSSSGRSPQTWKLSLSVTSPSGAVQRWSKRVSYASSLASAEWIVESPSAECGGAVGDLPLADYHSLVFTGLKENGASPRLGLSNLDIAYDPYGELSLPAPSLLLHGLTATYFVPFVPQGTADTQGQARCDPPIDAQAAVLAA